jgi:hypothetical protein
MKLDEIRARLRMGGDLRTATSVCHEVPVIDLAIPDSRCAVKSMLEQTLGTLGWENPEVVELPESWQSGKLSWCVEYGDAQKGPRERTQLKAVRIPGDDRMEFHITKGEGL